MAIFKQFDCSYTVKKVIFLTAYSKDFDLLVTVLTVENAGFGTGCNYEEKEKLKTRFSNIAVIKPWPLR